MMNYDPKKVVSENTETTKNLIVENKIETLLTPKTSNEVISETTLKKVFKEVWESRQNLISEQWVRGSDQLGYWKILFDQLKTGGIPVQWQVANDPVKSTFMYWGPWVIWKDANKNGGWPISFSGADKKGWLFKFPGGKYAGQPITNINLESKYINATFNLGQWGKVTGAVGGPQFSKLMQSKPKSSGAAACKDLAGSPIPSSKIPAIATQIFNELAYAFDGAGTYEEEAVAAYNKITCKQILDAVNAKVAARGMSGIKNVGDWAKDEMSDYDYDQYREIWSNLQKLGYKAPPVNYAMRAASVVGDVTGVNMNLKMAEALSQLFKDPLTGFEKMLTAYRDFLGGIVGAVATTILDATGVGKIATSVIWGIILAGDIATSIARGVPKWAEIILDSIVLLSTGAVGGAVGKILKPFFGSGVALEGLVAKMSKYSWFKSLIGLFERGSAKLLSVVEQGIAWVTSTGWWKYLANSTVGKLFTGAATKLAAYLEKISLTLAKGSGSAEAAVVTKTKDKIKSTISTDIAKDAAWSGSKEAAGMLGGEKAKTAVQTAQDVGDFKGGVTDYAKARGKLVSGGYDKSTYGSLAKSLAKTGKAVKGVGSDVYDLTS